MIECRHCKMLMWYQERMDKHKHAENPKYKLCCGNGKVEQPSLKHPPSLLSHFLFDQDSKDSKNFQSQGKTYNMIFTFTSLGAKLDNKFNYGTGPPTIRIQGQTCHRIGSLLPPKDGRVYNQPTISKATALIVMMLTRPKKETLLGKDNGDH
ncbi:uncharacterized protein LOC127093137 [Lathyrus oleraceus]|uniref:uncharacterized protein LOC127093137 n=1 Tax=Pisum sativum TaxID=3888 RepID=UPI0021CFF951|nr:uncharacterized protein LOC127093137 [Pisum sativum]XP_050887995.1 uncharacterized protein LOC127093137 [Pisum sativum]